MLDSPHNRNALSSRLLDELAEGLAEATADNTVRVVVLTASGSVFCSRADLSAAGRVVTSQMPDILTAIRAAPMPIVARVGGHARAGGIGLIAACDLALATRDSTFAFSEVRVGVAATKALLGEMSELTWSEGLERAGARSVELFAGDDAADGMDAFLHKRTPSWEVTIP